jgi:hypothetical protein
LSGLARFMVVLGLVVKRVPIEVKYYDDESKGDLVISLYEKLLCPRVTLNVDS